MPDKQSHTGYYASTPLGLVGNLKICLHTMRFSYHPKARLAYAFQPRMHFNLAFSVPLAESVKLLRLSLYLHLFLGCSCIYFGRVFRGELAARRF